MIDSRIKDFVRASLAGKAPTRVLTIVGPTGTGKTRSCEIAGRWWSWRHNYRFKTVSKLKFFEMCFAFSMTHPNRSLATLFSAGGSFTGADRAADAVKALLRPELLAIDDIGTEPRWCPPDTFSAGLCDIINSRNRLGRDTILTMNMDGEEVMARYNDRRLYSRIITGATVVPLAGEDKRGAA